ncbi:MAG: DnaJ domain-containing protein [bacterium]
MTRKTHYQQLEIPFGAPRRLIRKAYRRLARIYHPDKYPLEKKDWARSHFEKIEKAHRVLSDPRERALYDRKLAQKRMIPVEKKDFWEFWRQFLAGKEETRTVSYTEKMIMDSYEEDWLEEMHGGRAKNRHEFRKHLNFGKMQLAEGNVKKAKKEFIHADTLCKRNILTKFYIGYCLEMQGQYEEALKRYEFAVHVGISRPDKYVNKCLSIRERMVKLYEKTGSRKQARREKEKIRELKNRRSGFERFIQNQPATKTDAKLRDFFEWLTGIWK